MLTCYSSYECERAGGVAPPYDMQLPFKALYSMLRTYSQSDALVTLLCCHAGAATTDLALDLRKTGIRRPTIELLMSCGADELCGANQYFALTRCLVRLSMKEKPIPVTLLHREMVGQVQRWSTWMSKKVQRKDHIALPMYSGAVEGPKDLGILIMPSRSSESIEKGRGDARQDRSSTCSTPRIFSGWAIIGNGGTNVPWWLRKLPSPA